MFEVYVIRLVFETNLYEAIILSVLMGKLKKQGKDVSLSYTELMGIPLAEPLSFDERVELHV